MQGRQSIAAIPEELGRPDRDSIYSYRSDSSATIYFRQWHHAAEKLGWEWSFDRQTWHRTCMLEQVCQEGHHLTAADQACPHCSIDCVPRPKLHLPLQ